MPAEVLDKYGFVKPGYPIRIFIPAYDSEIIVTVKHRNNVMYEWFEYGPLPINKGTADEGVIKAGQTVESVMFPYEPLPGETRDDIFYFIESDRLMHVYLEFNPVIMRIYPEIPVNKKQYSLYGKVAQTVDRDFGWFRGNVEFIFLPKIHVGWTFSNKTNLDLYTMLRFKYAEYVIEPIYDVEDILKILLKQVPSYEIIYPALFGFDELESTIRDMHVPLIPRPRAYMTKEEIRRLVEESVGRMRA